MWGSLSKRPGPIRWKMKLSCRAANMTIRLKTSAFNQDTGTSIGAVSKHYAEYLQTAFLRPGADLPRQRVHVCRAELLETGRHDLGGVARQAGREVRPRG